ncbi:MAG: succinate dehydrogenase cytochrome b subunit [Opitutaceae bacterium]
MNLLGTFFRTTIGRKFLMALSGVVLIAFIVGHLIGNLQVFSGPDHINGYSYFLHSLGPTLWIVRGILILCAIVHIWAATVLAIEDRRARGGVPYRKNRWLDATFASRYMRWTGYVVLAFVIYHLAQFTFGGVQTATFKTHLARYTMASDYKVFGLTAVKAGTSVLDVRTMVILGFQNTAVAIFYLFAIGLLTLHLMHGGESLFQTFGWRDHRWARGLRVVVGVLCVAYFLGNLAIPGAVLAGYLKP